ncbi:MAG TPA: hypothetical protein VEZ13_10095, partial [Brevibacillus sp.]|nr:hypothetical protein [Brevibacillus sp.]
IKQYAVNLNKSHEQINWFSFPTLYFPQGKRLFQSSVRNERTLASPDTGPDPVAPILISKYPAANCNTHI